MLKLMRNLVAVGCALGLLGIRPAAADPAADNAGMRPKQRQGGPSLANSKAANPPSEARATELYAQADVCIRCEHQTTAELLPQLGHQILQTLATQAPESAKVRPDDF